MAAVEAADGVPTRLTAPEDRVLTAAAVMDSQELVEPLPKVIQVVQEAARVVREVAAAVVLVVQASPRLLRLLKAVTAAPVFSQQSQDLITEAAVEERQELLASGVSEEVVTLKVLLKQVLTAKPIQGAALVAKAAH